MDDAKFYLTTTIIPIAFVIFGAMARFAIKRKLEWELLYFGVELTLTGLAAAFLHLFNKPEASADPVPSVHLATGANAYGLLTKHPFTDTIIQLIASPSSWTYGERCGWAIFVLFGDLLILVFFHILFEIQARPLPKHKRFLEVLFLFLIADLLGGGSIVYMERLLR